MFQTHRKWIQAEHHFQKQSQKGDKIALKQLNKLEKIVQYLKFRTNKIPTSQFHKMDLSRRKRKIVWTHGCLQLRQANLNSMLQVRVLVTWARIAVLIKERDSHNWLKDAISQKSMIKVCLQKGINWSILLRYITTTNMLRKNHRDQHFSMTANMKMLM